MDTLECIRTRRSIRTFEDREVPDELVKQLLQAAMMAPSAGDQRPWEFLVLSDRALLARIPTVHPYAPFVKTAGRAVLACGNVARQTHEGYWVQDCAAAVQNLLLAAHALGLGACWCGVYPRDQRVEAFRELLGIPENVVPFALVAIGYPASKPRQPERFDASRVHYDKW